MLIIDGLDEGVIDERTEKTSYRDTTKFRKGKRKTKGRPR
jgi:hypothetical protein